MSYHVPRQNFETPVLQNFLDSETRVKARAHASMHWKLTISEMLSVEISVIQPHIYPPVQWPPSLLSLPKRLRAHFSIVSRLLTFICLPSIPSNLLKLFSSFRPSPRLHAEPSSRAGVELMVLSRLLRHTQAALLRRCSQTDC